VCEEPISLITESLRTSNLLSCLCRCQAWPGAIIAYCPHILTIDQVPMKLLLGPRQCAAKASPKAAITAVCFEKRKLFSKQ